MQSYKFEPKQIIILTLFIGLFVSVYQIVSPFLLSLVWAAIIAYTTWPIYQFILRKTNGKDTLTAFIMILSLLTLIATPFIVVGLSLSENAPYIYNIVLSAIQHKESIPIDWIKNIPIIGSEAYNFSANLINGNQETIATIKKYLLQLPLKNWIFVIAQSFIQAIILILLSLFIAFFLYKNGDSIVVKLNVAINSLLAERGIRILNIAGNMTSGVVNGIVGTALAQGILAFIGFLIAGIPNLFLLSFLTFFLSVVPVGAPLIWIPVAGWLFSNGESGWAIFIIIWGTLIIGSADNAIKPYLISKGGDLSFPMVFLGVIGGAMAFGVIGIFLGPVLLAVAMTIINEWVNAQKNNS